ncbi:MAG: transposase [Treponema sp.]|nr:transposase [Treponema sp.]
MVLKHTHLSRGRSGSFISAYGISVLLGNHIHFLIKPGKDGNLSEIMQWIKCNFAKTWNKANERKGHVWGERFYSRIINGMADFFRVREYIVLCRMS